MSIYQLKTQFQHQLRPISDSLVRQGYTANQVTISAVILSGGVAYLIAYPARSRPAIWYGLPVGLFVRMAMNAIDGMMAKEHGQASKLGAWLNEAGDIISDRLLIASLTPYVSARNLSLRPISYLTFTTEVIAILSQQLVHERANHGPLGKSDRALELGVMGVLIGSGVSLLPVARWLILANEFLLIKTIVNRLQFIIWRCWQEQNKREYQRLLNANHPFQSHYLVGTQTPLEVDLSYLPSNNLMPFSPSLLSNLPNEPIMTIPTKTLETSKETILEIANNTAVNPTPITEMISCFNSYDGTAMFYRYWLSKPWDEIQANHQKGVREKIVILLHRGHEHSGRLGEMTVAFTMAGYQVFAWDARGNGRSGGERDHAENFAQLVRDLEEFVSIVKNQTHAVTEDILLVASSLGAVIAASWVHDYAPTVRGMILGTPAFAIRLYVPFAIPALKVAKKLGLVNRVSSYVKAKVLTHDSEAQQAYNDDPLISSSISRDLLIDSLATGSRLLDDAGAFTTPTMILCAGKDYVVDKQKIRDFYDTIRSPIKTWHFYPDSYHAIFHEVNKDQVFHDCLTFAEKIFAKPITVVDLQHADDPTSHADSHSKDRVDRLAVKGFNPQFAITKLAIQKFGYISDGVATGIQRGFDSGTSLEKVYQNQPNGVNLLGKWVDGFYLNNIGWQGIRIRKQHLLELGEMAMDKLSHNGKNHTITALDIASGNGFYMFELCEKFPQLNAELRDYDSHNVSVMTEKAQSLSLQNRVKVVQKDAFDPDSYNNKGAFDLAVASGVFELFSDNHLIKTAIAEIFEQLNDGGYFIYTNQPYHPEQEFIGKTLNSHQGKDWVMRCRSQAEIDQLVGQAGFEKVTMRIDKFGIFTVSLAVKKS